MTSGPIPNSYWVIPGKFMAGPYPGFQVESETHDRLRWLTQQGVTACIDLTEEGDPELTSYADMWIDESASMGVIVRYVRLAIPDFSTPSRELMTKILDTIDSLLNGREVVYLHCYGGIGRTGMTVACYLVRQGLSGASALEQLDNLRKDTPNAWKHSPETDEQHQFVLDWVKWDSPRKNI